MDKDILKGQKGKDGYIQDYLPGMSDDDLGIDPNSAGELEKEKEEEEEVLTIADFIKKLDELDGIIFAKEKLNLPTDDEIKEFNALLDEAMRLSLIKSSEAFYKS